MPAESRLLLSGRPADVCVVRPGGGALTSNLPGLSPHGRLVIARLENTRLQPGQVLETIRHWERLVRDPAHRLYDPRFCPDETPTSSRHSSTESTNAGDGDRRTRDITQLWSASVG
jgi:hypothetical protein